MQLVLDMAVCMVIMAAMYIESVPNRKSPPCILLRESCREEGKVRKRTLANLTHLPPEIVDGIRVMLKGGVVLEDAGSGFEIVRSLPHGHVAAVLGTMRRLGLAKLLEVRGCRERDLVLAMIAARVIAPGSKLATSRGFSSETATSSLREEFEISDATENELYAAMDWLLERQLGTESKLASRHLKDGVLVLYDLTSTYMEGRCCPLARFGYNRDGKKGKLQIEFGLLCDAEGRPVAVQVFEGNASDSSTLGDQVRKLRERFGLNRVVLVGDRGMITEARIREDLRPVEGLDWISALRAPAIRKLVDDNTIQLSLFDERDMAEVTSDDYPGERLVVCRNPFLAEERRRKRTELLACTEQQLEKVATAVSRDKRPLRGAGKIGLRVGRIIDKYKMAKHFKLEIGEDSFSYERNEQKIADEAALDGLYVIRSSLPSSAMDAEGLVSSYKGLSVVERAFRRMKTVDLKVRPIYHRSADRVRAHVFLCMLAYYVEWHMRQALKSLLFDDEDKAQAEADRKSVVAPAKRSASALTKARTKRNDQGDPVHSFQTLLEDLATICKNRVQPAIKNAPHFEKITIPTRLQSRALRLLGVRLAKH